MLSAEPFEPVDVSGSGVRKSRPWWWGVAVKVVVTVAGFGLLLVGVVMMVTPGPGILGIVGGLALLATEYRWAEGALRKAKAKADDARVKTRARFRRRTR